jgi:oligoribonuclease NrnB/cAMP/cGMP phosphodiesterase (DHH superfamily)
MKMFTENQTDSWQASTSKRVTMSKTNRKRLHSSIDYCSPEEYECIEMKKAA